MKVRLTKYDARWPDIYVAETRLLRRILTCEIIRFDHFGSTSVAGMMAKPVIDLMCIVKDINAVDSDEDSLRAHGYDAAGEWGIPGRLLFRKGGDDRTHHLHVYQFGNPQISRHLIVRDYLRRHPHEVDAYSQLKEELCNNCDETSYYSQAKKPYVQALEQRALLWHEKQWSP